MFVTFEGGEGAGKSTLIKRLTSALEASQSPVFSTREPGGSALGEQLRELLLTFSGTLATRAELALFLAGRAQHLQEAILPALKEGKVVLCDRFNDSTIAYQAYGRGLELEAVRKACQFFSQGMEPDLTFYLDLDPSIGIERVKRAFQLDRFEQEQIAFHQKIRAGFLALAKENPRRIHVIDAQQSADQVFTEAYAVLQARRY
jgi:dTMP kinase